MTPMSQHDLAHTPAAAPPEGQASNFVDPPSQQSAMIAVSTVMMAWTLAVMLVRLYTSFRITRLPGWEDWTCVLAVVFLFGYIGIILSLSHVSRHMWDVPVLWFTENYWKIRFAGNTLQALAYFTSRLPILLLYLRVFGKNKSLRIACYGAIAAAFPIYITSIPLISYFCTPPLGGDWGSLDVFAKCKRLLAWALVQGSCDVALNVYIFVLPLPTLLGLQMPMRKKLGVLAIFLTGLLAVVSSAVGLYYRYQLSFTPDVNWNEGAFICMSIVETGVAIICSCMPGCASFARHTLKGSRFIMSVRSVLSRYGPGPSNRVIAGTPKLSNAPSSNSELVRDPRSAPDFQPALPNDCYVELQESRGSTWTRGHYSARVVHPAGANGSGPYRSKGIEKTVALEVV